VHKKSQLLEQKIKEYNLWGKVRLRDCKIKLIESGERREDPQIRIKPTSILCDQQFMRCFIEEGKKIISNRKGERHELSTGSTISTTQSN
jgi:hypothetical protein